MKTWVKLLPLFVVKWLAGRHCERTTIGNQVFVIAFKDVLIAAERKR